MALVPSTPVSAQSVGAAATIASPTFTSVLGNLLVANGNESTSTALVATPFTDSVGGQSNTWQQAVPLVGTSGGGGTTQYYAKNLANAGTGHVVTFHFGTTDFISVAVIQISGADRAAPFDKSATSVVTGSISANPHATANTAATTLADEICVAGMNHSGSGNQTFASNNGYTIQTSQTNTTNQPIVLSTKIVAATGAQSESYNLTANASVAWNALVGTYKAASALYPIITANTASGTGSAGAAITPSLSSLTVGNYLVLLIAHNSNIAVPTPAGWALVPGTANTQDPTGATSDRSIAAFTKSVTATTDSASLTTSGKYEWTLVEVAQTSGPRASSGNTGFVTTAGANPTMNSGAGVLTNDLLISYVATMTASSTFTAGAGYTATPSAAPATTNVSSRAETELAASDGATAAPFVNASTTLWSELAFSMAPFVATLNPPILQAVKRASFF